MTSVCVGSLHIINQLISTAATVKNLLPVRPGKFFDWRHGRVYYRKFGSGKPLLLIHDLDPSSSAYEWNQLEQQLAKDFTVYSIDLPGCGRSDKAEHDLHQLLYVQLLNDFTEKVIKRKTSVAATGLSGSFVIMAANNNENLFDKIFLINPKSINALNQIPNPKSRIAKLLINCPVLGTTLYYILMNRTNVEYNFTENLFPQSFSSSPDGPWTSTMNVPTGKETAEKYLLSSIKGNFVNIDISHALKKSGQQHLHYRRSFHSGINSIIHGYETLNPAIESALVEKSRLPSSAGMPGSILPDHESLLLIFFVKRLPPANSCLGDSLFFLRAELI